MAANQRKSDRSDEVPDSKRRPRNDPRRLKAFSDRLNLMLAEIGLPERGRAKVIKDRLGVGGTTAANWLRGDSYPSFEELGRMRRLGLDPMRLLADKADVPPSKASPRVSPSTVSTRLARLLESRQVLPVVQLRTEDGDWDHTALPNQIWRQFLGQNLSGFVLLTMPGDSMGDRIKAGTPLLIDTNVKQIAEDNGIYALLLGESVIVRRVQRRLQGGYLIVSDNSVVPPEAIDRLGAHDDESSKAGAVLVLGRVALAIQKL